jgi:hypothetical protein
MRFMKVFLTPIPTIIILMVLFITACADYDEDDAFSGDYPSKTAFGLMNTKEKILHDQIATNWGQSHMLALRDAVRKRTLVPLENELPYGDMPGVIVTINNTILDPDGQSDSRKSNRFNSLAPEWYRIIQRMAERGEMKVLKGTPPPEPEPDEKEEVMEAKATGLPSESWTPPALIKWDAKDIAPTEVVSGLKFSLIKCDQAMDYFDVIIEDKRPVLMGDVQTMKEMFSICNARAIQDFYKD